MKYPNFLTKDSIIGITAPSSGVGEKLENYKLSIKNINNYFRTIETASVRNKSIVSNTKEIRAYELDSLIEDNKIDMIWCASGGDFFLEILPFINLDKLLDKPKWIQGYSDPTSLLYLITTKLDIATIYGFNASSFDNDKLHSSQIYNFDILKGNIPFIYNSDYYEKLSDREDFKYNLINKTNIKSNKKIFNLTGRLIGGCIDSLKDIIGTIYDYTNDFIKRYEKDGVIWYFDVFDMSSLKLYLTLLQMKYANYFRCTKLIMFGRVFIPKEEILSYIDAIDKALGNIPYIIDADIGHTNPKTTLINGCICNVIYEKSSYVIKQELR